MSAFTPEQEARLREIVREEMGLDAGLVAEVRQLRADVSGMQEASGKTACLLDRWDGDSLSPDRAGMQRPTGPTAPQSGQADD